MNNSNEIQAGGTVGQPSEQDNTMSAMRGENQEPIPQELDNSKEVVLVVTRSESPQPHPWSATLELAVQDKQSTESIAVLDDGDDHRGPLGRPVHWWIERRGDRIVVCSRTEVTATELARVSEHFKCSLPLVREITIEADVTDLWDPDSAVAQIEGVFGETALAKILGLDLTGYMETTMALAEDKMRPVFHAIAERIYAIPTRLHRKVIGIWSGESDRWVSVYGKVTDDPADTIVTMLSYLESLVVTGILTGFQSVLLTMELQDLAAELKGERQ